MKLKFYSVEVTIAFLIILTTTGHALFRIPETKKIAEHLLHTAEAVLLYQLKDDVKELYLSASIIQKNDHSNVIRGISVNGLTYKKNQVGTFTADRLEYQEEKQLLYLTEHIFANFAPYTFTCHDAKYEKKENYFHCFSQAAITIDQAKSGDTVKIFSDFSKANLETKYSKYWGHVKGNIKRQKGFQPPSKFSSDELVIYGEEMQANLLGNVWFQHDTYEVTGRRAEIFFDNYNKKLKYFDVYDDVVVTQRIPTLPGGLRKAYCEKMEGVRSEGLLTLTGTPRIEQGRDIIRGTKITLRQRANLVEVDDAVSNIIYDDKK
jgi:lipopolysaccharide export system protein LptA